jgi:hypothetical protein
MAHPGQHVHRGAAIDWQHALALAFYRVLGFAVVRRAEGDDVAIIRNEHGVELNR